jgi:4-amino-4-deoxy-L-arabinose transferase-like glycosyltransferase
MRPAIPVVFERAKQHLRRELRLPRYAIAVIVILLVAFDLRIQSVLHTDMGTRVRDDAREYVQYAYNLKHFGVYSRSDTLFDENPPPPTPDAKRAPLYPLFIAPFLSQPLLHSDLETVARVQAVLSTITVLLVFWLARLILPLSLALTAAALTALSPHLITMNIYMLSETLSCFMLVLAMYLTAKTIGPTAPRIPLLTGVVLAGAALTHPMALFLVLPLAIFLLLAWGWKNGHRKLALLALGFALVYGPWLVRNVATLGATGDSTLSLAALRSGVYRNLMYNDDPQSFAYPYRFDPSYETTSQDFPSVIAEVIRSFKDAPIEQLHWYLVGKPTLLWSWTNAEGRGKYDIFIYPVRHSPYDYLPQFRASKSLMKFTHPAWVVLMLAGVIVAWLPAAWSGLSSVSLFAARAVALLLLYHAAVMIVGFSFPRYSIPMRPFLYIMAMLPLAVGVKWLIAKRWIRLGASRAKSAKNKK